MPNMKPISVAQLKLLKKLDQKKYRQESGKFAVEGPHLVAGLLSSDWEVDYVLFRKDTFEEGRLGAISASAKKRGIQVQLAARREFDAVASHAQKLALVDALFAVSGVDASIVTIEDNEIRRIANELKIEHAEYIALRAKHLAHFEVLRSRARRAEP